MPYPQEEQDIIDLIIKKATHEKAYRNKLFSRPKEVLTEAGMKIPDIVDVRVYYDTSDKICIEPIIEQRTILVLNSFNDASTNFW